MEKLTLTSKEDISAYYRGTIIQKAIDVELRMDIIIGRFLSSNNQDKTLDTIGIFDMAESIGFHAKNMGIHYIIKKHYPEFKKEHPNLLSNIDYLIDTRNKVAHKRPDLSNYDFSILRWSKTTKTGVVEKEFLLNNELFLKYKAKADEVFLELIYLENLIITGDERNFKD